MMFVNLFKLLYRTVALKLTGSCSNHTSDYDAAALTYDDYYSRYLSGNSQGLLKRLPLGSGITVLDLACGTGFFTHRIATRVGQHGKVIAVDLSAGMLARNRENALSLGLGNIHFVEADALEYLRTLESNSMDGVVCGWGICYMDHAELRREIERVVCPGGFIGIIENRACTLKTISDLFRKVLLRYPDALVKNMMIHLPKDHHYLRKTFCKGVFEPVYAWDDHVTVPCKNGQEVADYMVKSGASAGFLDALDKQKIDSVMAEFIKAADHCFRHGSMLVKHECCALLATKNVSQSSSLHY